MKLLYTLLLVCGLIQISIKPSDASPNTTQLKIQIASYLNIHLNLLAHNICVKFKNISELIVQDRFLQQTTRPLMKEFKRNMTNFLQIYPVYMKYGLEARLLITFSGIIQDFYGQDNSDDSRYISQLLEKLGLDEIYDQYENKAMKFISTKFLPKFDELINTISVGETVGLVKWLNLLKQCQDYECFAVNFNKFEEINLKPKEQLLVNVREQLQDIYMIYANNTFAIAKSVLNDTRLAQLSPNLRQQLFYHLNTYIRKYQNNKAVSQLRNIISYFDLNIISRFYQNYIALEERQLLIKIFDEQGYAQFTLNFEKTFDEYLLKDFSYNFEHFRESLNQEELKQEKAVLNWFDNFKGASTYMERAAAFNSVYNILKKL